MSLHFWRKWFTISVFPRILSLEEDGPMWQLHCNEGISKVEGFD